MTVWVLRDGGRLASASSVDGEMRGELKQGSMVSMVHMSVFYHSDILFFSFRCLAAQYLPFCRCALVIVQAAASRGLVAPVKN